MASSLNSPTPQERWHRFTAATVRAFHRYATWLVSLSWWRFGWYALVLIIVTGLLQKLPPFSLTYYETIVDSATHRKAKARVPTPPPAPSAPAVAAPQPPEHAEQPEKPEKPESPSPAPSPKPAANPDGSRSVDIKLPGITVNAKDHSAKTKGVNITFTGDGIHISSDDGADAPATAASQAASAARAAEESASAATAAVRSAKDRAAAARFEAAAQRDAGLAKSFAARAAAEQARAAVAGSAEAASAAASAAAAARSAAASAAAEAASAAGTAQTAVDMVVGGQHVRIDLPANANADDVREAIEQAKASIVEQLQDDEEKRRAAEQEAADRATEAAEKALHHDDDADDGDSGDSGGGRRTMHARTINTVPLSMLAVWWILGSMLIKITYKGRIQAEVKAAEATETAEAESLRRQVLEARMAMMQAQVEPHFLFNTLASIDHLIEFDPKRASQMQRNLISLLRASMPSMRSTDSDLRPLDLELAVVRPYLEILKVRMEERLTTEIDVPDGLLSAEFPP